MSEQRTIEILKKLISFPSVSKNPNIDLIHYISDMISNKNCTPKIIKNHDGSKANLFAAIGPKDISGVMLSGHTDVVPIEGQEWTKPPFDCVYENGLYYGRGTADMKGFVACAVNAFIKAQESILKTPLYLALSYDEELGCLGVHSLIDMMKTSTYTPSMCIVGEPTSMAIATGHKGKTALRAECIGTEAHSALAPSATNAIHLACDLISELRKIQSEIEVHGHKDNDYDIPFTTLHVGKINGGIVLNIVPKQTSVDFEIRNLALDNPREILKEINVRINSVVKVAQKRSPAANINITSTNEYPGLNTDINSEIVAFVSSLTGANNTIKVAFGTEGGLFSSKLSIPTVVCGPGSMEQGHKPDEFVSAEQLSSCDAMLDTLLKRLQDGL